MTGLLIRLFVERGGKDGKAVPRGRYGLLSSLVGISCNAVLFVIKFLIGTLSGSVSIMADSVNNLSDAGSSIVTLVGFSVSEKPADEGHPFGHARAEYIGGLAVSFMMLVLGVEFFRTSLARILSPQELDISLAAIVVLALSILLKLWMASFNRFVGRRIDSTALLATAQDSINDVLTTSAVLAATIVSKYTGLLLDGWMGVLVALFILWSGFLVARDTISPLLGTSPPAELVKSIQDKVRSYDNILGMHDLMIHSYGPERWFASLHAEVDAKRDILKSHDLIDNIEREVLESLGVNLVIHMDPIVTDDPVLNELHQLVERGVKKMNPQISVHDFRMVKGDTHSNLIFDIALPAGFLKNDAEICEQVEDILKACDDKYYAVITVDRSYVSSVKTVES